MLLMSNTSIKTSVPKFELESVEIEERTARAARIYFESQFNGLIFLRRCCPHRFSTRS